MSTKLKLVITVILLTGLTFTIYNIVGNNNYNHDVATTKSVSEPSYYESTNKQTASYIDDDNSSLKSMTHNSRQLLNPSGILLSGKVIDKITSNPVKSFYVVLRRHDNRQMIISETVTNDDGEFSFTISEGGMHTLDIHSSRYPSERISDLEIANNTGLSDLLIKLDPHESVSGHVYDIITGKPIEGAVVGAWDLTDLYGNYYKSPEYSIQSKSDERGHFTLQGLKIHWAKYNDKQLSKYGSNWWIFAAHDDYAIGFVEAVPGDNDLKIYLEDGYRFYGQVLDDDGKPKNGVYISIGVKLFDKAKSSFKYWGGPREWFPVMTDSDGRYITSKVLPGWVYVSASPPRGEPEDLFGFIKEKKHIEVIDQNIEVNFGIPDKFATWQGSLIDSQGNGISKGKLTLIRSKKDKEIGSMALGRSVVCDDNGQFIIPKLVPTRYEVHVKLPEMRRKVFSECTIANPGHIYKDLVIPGSNIHVVLLDANTGQPLQSKRAFVEAFTTKPVRRDYRSEFANNGLFELRGVPPGNYRVIAKADDCTLSYIDNVIVEGGVDVNDLHIIVTPGGKLCCRCIDFKKTSSFRVDLRRSDGKKQYIWPDYSNSDKCHFKTKDIESGVWEAVIRFYDNKSLAGIITRTIEIAVGCQSELVLYPDDFILSDKDIAIYGNIYFSTGTPLSKAVVTILGHNIEDAQVNKWCRVNEQGSYSFDCLKPGYYSLRIDTHDQGTLYNEFNILNNSNKLIEYNIEIPSATITGKLILINSILIKYIETSWYVHLHNVKTGEGVRGYLLYQNNKDNSFRITGINSGLYQLEINGIAIDRFMSKEISIIENQTINIGETTIDFTPSVVINYLDTKGQPVNYCTAALPDYNIKLKDNSENIGKGKYLYYNLPTGQVKFRFTRTGYKEHNTTINIQPGIVEEEQVILHSDE